MNDATSKIVMVIVAIIGVAILSVLVSKNAQTPQVIQAFGTALSNLIKAATGPVSGSSGLPSVPTLGTG